MKEMQYLSEKEKQSIRVLNFIASYDGIIGNEENIIYLLEEGIKEFISKKNTHLVFINRNVYPIKINVRK